MAGRVGQAIAETGKSEGSVAETGCGKNGIGQKLGSSPAVRLIQP